MAENIVATGRIFELVQIPQPDGRVFEVARRAPGVRVIVADRQKREVLLTKEHRYGLDGWEWDYRLPGGKVFDSLKEFEAFRDSQRDILDEATIRAREEAAEEAGIHINSLKFYKKSVLGATVSWDLYVFEAIDWQPHPDGQNLKEDEREGIEVQMYPYAQAERMILDGSLQEERIALILLQWLKQQAA